MAEIKSALAEQWLRRRAATGETASEAELVVRACWHLESATHYRGCRDEALGWQHIEAAHALLQPLLTCRGMLPPEPSPLDPGWSS